ncbi:Crp/Fnr family transcriptional regulator [Nibricoccus aquaticus]|nr:Crp/Fnr family transcriptional regulator [Nibricoccus aquaticus]
MMPTTRAKDATEKKAGEPMAALRGAGLALTLRGSQLFSGLPEADVAAIAGLVRVKSLEKDAYLFHEGEAAEGFYVVQRGAINVHRVSATGKEQVIYVFRAGESLAEAALASPTGYPANARAVETSSVLLIPKTEFLALVAKRPDLAMRMLGSMSQHLRVLVGLLDDLTLKDVETRLANWLVKRLSAASSAGGIGKTVTVKLGGTKRVLAAELSTTAETLSRTLGRFREAGLIEVSGAAVVVKKPNELVALLKRNLGEG